MTSSKMRCVFELPTDVPDEAPAAAPGVRVSYRQGWICRLPGARENITVCGVAPVPASTHRVS